MREDKIHKVDLKNQLKNRHKHHLKFQKGCLNPFGGLNENKEMDNMNHSLSEAKKKGYHLNKNAGNVEHNINMFNKMNSPVDAPSNNPISGPFGGEVCVESLDEARNPYFTPYGYRDAAKVLNGKAPDYYYHLKEIEMDTGDGEKLARYARKIGLPVVQDPNDDPDYPTFYILGKYHWNDYFYPYPSNHEPKIEESMTKVASKDNDISESRQGECDRCGHILTDGGHCPVCDLGDEDARESHTLYTQDIAYDDDIDELYLSKDFEDDGSNEDIDVNCEDCGTLIKVPADSVGPFKCATCATKNESYIITGRDEEGFKYYNIDNDTWSSNIDDSKRYDSLDIAHHDFYEIIGKYKNQFKRIFVPVFD